MPRKKTSAGKEAKEKARTVQTSLYIPEDVLKEVQKHRVSMGLPRDNAFYMAAIKEKLAREKRKK